MKKARRVLAMIGVILLIAMYASTMVFALLQHPYSKNMLMASIYCTIAVPVLLFGLTLVTKNLRDSSKDTLPDEEETSKDN